MDAERLDTERVEPEREDELATPAERAAEPMLRLEPMLLEELPATRAPALLMRAGRSDTQW